MRIGIVCEGLTDVHAIVSFLGASLANRGFDPVFVTLQPARRFFGLLREAGRQTGARRALNNASQLSGFAKRDDLPLLPDKEIVAFRRATGSL